MADALDSGSSGSLSCESSSLFFRMKPITIAVMGFLFTPVFMQVCEIFAYQRNSDISVKNVVLDYDATRNATQK